LLVVRRPLLRWLRRRVRWFLPRARWRRQGSFGLVARAVPRRIGVSCLLAGVPQLGRGCASSQVALGSRVRSQITDWARIGRCRVATAVAAAAAVTAAAVAVAIGAQFQLHALDQSGQIHGDGIARVVLVPAV